MELILNAAYVTFLGTMQDSLGRAHEDVSLGESVNRRASQSQEYEEQGEVETHALGSALIPHPILLLSDQDFSVSS